MDGFRKLAESDLWALGYNRNVLHPEGRAIFADDDRLGNVLSPVNQSDGTDVDLLQTFLDEASACVRIVIGELLFDLGEAQGP